MKHYFIQQNYFPRLTLFFAGWGMDECPFMDYCPENSDLLVCYDYRSLDFDFTLLQGYQEIRLIAWSMGVWAASMVLQDMDLPICESVALNGTVTPVDDLKGISQQVFEGTLEGLNEGTLEKFIRRMCLKKENLETFLSKRPQRAVEELQEELRRIGEQVKSCAVPSFAWERAVIGKNDLIFTAVNQRNAWTGTEVAEYDIPHYSEEIMRDLLCPSVI